ncbi:uncharacterized protein LOC116422179 [Sarcophilus harrisii]|uniref:uncharacterized protein LOC116422179 n=1 Tax=Sarcophilus harrisii TaxID=9305 RepID=UPI001301E4ED|nr:uncharacterized protein LOC116422179 [Sarcophilus harrisii]
MTRSSVSHSRGRAAEEARRVPGGGGNKSAGAHRPLVAKSGTAGGCSGSRQPGAGVSPSPGGEAKTRRGRVPGRAPRLPRKPLGTLPREGAGPQRATPDVRLGRGKQTPRGHSGTGAGGPAATGRGGRDPGLAAGGPAASGHPARPEWGGGDFPAAREACAALPPAPRRVRVYVRLWRPPPNLRGARGLWASPEVRPRRCLASRRSRGYVSRRAPQPRSGKRPGSPRGASGCPLLKQLLKRKGSDFPSPVFCSHGDLCRAPARKPPERGCRSGRLRRGGSLEEAGPGRAVGAPEKPGAGSGRGGDDGSAVPTRSVTT